MGILLVAKILRRAIKEAPQWRRVNEMWTRGEIIRSSIAGVEILKLLVLF